MHADKENEWAEFQRRPSWAAVTSATKARAGWHNAIHHPGPNALEYDLLDSNFGVALWRQHALQPRRALQRLGPLLFLALPDLASLTQPQLYVRSVRHFFARGDRLRAALSCLYVFGTPQILLLTQGLSRGLACIALLIVASLAHPLTFFFYVEHYAHEADFTHERTDSATTRLTPESFWLRSDAADAGAHSDGWRQDFVRYNLECTTNLASNWWLRWVVGLGPATIVNHIEHHLFPGISFVHYPLMAPVIEAFCREHGMPYRSYSLFEYVAARWSLLNKLKPERS
mmetsp:Transcript_23083/g.75248  ORF Transcript_23083/g.75248 Transcript_23083/m.75248 type:complete len:286 (+) Transcript_23083:784-1641(+)